MHNRQWRLENNYASSYQRMDLQCDKMWRFVPLSGTQCSKANEDDFFVRRSYEISVSLEGR